jgi:hypothetical protein
MMHKSNYAATCLGRRPITDPAEFGLCIIVLKGDLESGLQFSVNSRQMLSVAPVVLAIDGYAPGPSAR